MPLSRLPYPLTLSFSLYVSIYLFPLFSLDCPSAFHVTQKAICTTASSIPEGSSRCIIRMLEKKRWSWKYPSEGGRNLVYPRFYLVTPKLDDTNAFTLYNCEDRAVPFVLHT